MNPHQNAWLARLEAGLQERQASGLLRALRPLEAAAGPEVTAHGRRFVQFCSNNYLGLSQHPEVIAAAREAVALWGAGSGASRLVAGSLAIHHELEAAIAAFKQTASALLFPTGFMANLAVLTTFASENDIVISDKLNHASLLDAARYSGAHHRTFPHRNYGRAAELLSRPAEHPSGARFVVSDSVFSMDGDLANLPALCNAAEKSGAIVILDEAHGTGILGERGAGLAELQQVESRITLTVGTLSKALGSIGGFVAGPKTAIDALINSARSFIYTTALPAGAAAAALAALKIIERDPAPRRRVLSLSAHVRQELTAMGYDCGDSQTPILPVILGSADAALAASQVLETRGLLIPAIRPPTVPPNTARLRISLMASHTDAHIEQFLAAMHDLRDPARA